MGFLGKKDVGNDKVYMKKIKKYVFDRTGKKSTATTLTGARKEADAAGKLAPTEGWKGYDQDTRIEVPIKKTLSERLGGKAGKEKRRLKKKRGEVPSTTKTVKVKNAEHAEKLHKKRRGITDKKHLDKKAAATGRKTYKGDVSYSDVKKRKKGADYSARLKEAHGVGYETTLGLKPPSAFAAAKTATKKKRKKHTKRAARERFREAVVEKNKTPGRTKKTAKKIGKGIGKLVGKVADKLPGGEKRKKKKKQKVAHDKKVKAMGGIPKIQM